MAPLREEETPPGRGGTSLSQKYNYLNEMLIFSLPT